jgi:hypothetical protein
MGMKPTIDVHIDELLLDGVRSFDEKRIVLALERELARRVADRHESAIVTASGDVVGTTAVQVANAIQKVLIK